MLEVYPEHALPFSPNPPLKKLVVIASSPEAIAQLQKVFARACNTWDDAPKEVKQAHDLVVHGKILQEYR